MKKIFLYSITCFIFNSLIAQKPSYLDYMKALSDLSKKDKNGIYQKFFNKCKDLPASEKTGSGCERTLSFKVMSDAQKYLNEKMYNKNN